MKNRGKNILAVSFLTLLIMAYMLGCGKKSEGGSYGPGAMEVSEKASDDAGSNSGAASSGEPAMTEEPSESTPEGSGEISATDTAGETELLRNGECFVKYGDKIYFHAPDKEGMKTTAIFGDFLNGECGTTEFLAYDTLTGDTESIMNDHSWGGIYICNDLMYLEEMSTDGDMPSSGTGVYDIAKNFEAEYKDEENVFAASEDGSAVVTGYFDGDKEGYILHVRTADENDYTVENENIQPFVKCEKDRLFYTTYSYNTEKYMLYEYDYGKDSICLGEIPGAAGTSSSMGPGEIDNAMTDGDGVYFAVNYYEGTGHFLSGSYLVSAVCGQENSLDYKETPGGNHEEGDDPSEPVFTVRNGEFITDIDGTPNTAGVNKKGDLVFYDENGAEVTVASGYGSSVNTDGYLESSVEGLTLIDGRIYGYRNGLERAEEEDIGWREAFRRAKTTVFCVDTGNGKETVLWETNP